ncbi:MAG TPA: Ig-like domain-containing protein, partial [Candidatus Thermoplasmatota archaeon]|nr:Ig-like domain-containing protein [Candidatus Thermoplasmatota archaeon]
MFPGGKGFLFNTGKTRNYHKRFLSVKNNPAGKTLLLSFTVILIVPFSDFSSLHYHDSISLVPSQGRGITWDVAIQCSNTGGQNDYVIFGEAPDANDGPPPDSYDVAKPPPPIPPYVRVWLNDNLPTPYDVLWKDYRSYPDSFKVWNLTVQWMPSSGSSPTTITLAWNPALVALSEYTSVTLCTTDGTPLQDMRVNSTYIFSCPAYMPQYFRIIGQVSSNNPPVANPDAYSTNQDTSLSVVAPGVLSNDTDPDGDSLTAVKVSDPSHGTLAFHSNGSFVYTPTLHFFGNDSFTYKAYDGTAYSNNATVSLSIAPFHYILTISCQGSGTVTKNPDQSWYTYGQVVTLTAIPSTGWVFNHWAGDLSGSTNPTTITMNGNKSVIANFTAIHYTLTITIQGGGTVTKNPDHPWYLYGTVVTLTAISTSHRVFDHWAG